MNLFNPERQLTWPADDIALVKALREKTTLWLKQHHEHRYADWKAIVKMLILVTSCLSCYIAALSQNDVLFFSLWYQSMMILAMLLLVNVIHDASHNAFFRRKSNNLWLSRVIAIPFGLDSDCWQVRHVRFHHGYVNVECYDPDIAENGLLRQSPWQRWRPFMRAQRFYWPLIAALTFPWYIWIVDWLDRSGMTPITRYLPKRGLAGWTPFLIGKITHITFCLILPGWLLADRFSFFTILVTYWISLMISSMICVTLIIGTHWAKGHSQLPPETGKMPAGRLGHVFSTTFDWSTGSDWHSYWLGGLNLHLTHHIFPHWHHRHYPALSNIISQIAQQQGLDYQMLSVSALFKQQQQFLKLMGKPPQEAER